MIHIHLQLDPKTGNVKETFRLKPNTTMIKVPMDVTLLQKFDFTTMGSPHSYFLKRD